MEEEREKQVAQLLLSSLDPRHNKEAERALGQQEEKPGYSLCLLRIVALNNKYGNTTQLASALYFKNFLKRIWTDENGTHGLPEEEVDTIKREIIPLMISVPPALQSQLGETVGIIADSDFWEQWDTLVDDLVSRLTLNNPIVNQGVLQVAHSIFKRWRPLFRSDALFTEINHVLGKFETPFLTLLARTDKAIEKNKSDKAMLRQSVNTLNLLIKLFYDLSCQDLPPQFEENIPDIVSLLQKYITFDNPSLHTDNDDEAGPLEFVKSGILDVLTLYIQKYEDVFGFHVGTFVASSWNLLTTIGSETKYDILVSKALRFLTSISRIKQHAQTFNNASTMGQILENVILPNLALRDSDIEMFEDEPIEFTRRDLEGSDNDTRRRAATDFLRTLLAQFDTLVTDIVSHYINHFLLQYRSNPQAHWREKDTAVYLFSSIAATGTITTTQGAKTINAHVNVIDFFQTDIANDLVSDTGIEPILRVDAIKYLYTFRSQINKERWQDAFPFLVRHLSSSNYVVYTYAAIAIERALALADENSQPMIDKASLLPFSKDLLEYLFRLIEKHKSDDRSQTAAKVQENEFLMRCIMRILIVIKDGVMPQVRDVLNHLVSITEDICANPSNPRFCYYHFEALGALIRFAAPSQSQVLEIALSRPFQAILQNDVQDFVPYILQLYAALLEANPSSVMSEYYKPLIPAVLSVDYWLSKGNVPALVRLLSSIIIRGSSDIVASDHIEPILGIFKQLVATKTNEIYAFELLECILSSIPRSILDNYLIPIMQMLLSKLHDNKTDAFSSRFVRLYHFFSAKGNLGYGTDFFIHIVEQIQVDIFRPLYLNIILPETPRLIRPLDRKAAAVSLTKTLTESVAFAETYKKGWALTCNTLLELLVKPPVPTIMDEIIVDHDVDDMSFGVGFTQLSTIRQAARDPCPEVISIKLWVGHTLQASQRKIGPFAEERLSPETRQTLKEYLRI